MNHSSNDSLHNQQNTKVKTRFKESHEQFTESQHIPRTSMGLHN